MTAYATLASIPGGRSLTDWFGFTPNFHDAKLLSLDLSSAGQSTLVLYAWRMTDVVDHQGYFVLDRHVVVTFTLTDTTAVSITAFDAPAIIHELTISEADVGSEYTGTRPGYRLRWTSSYGAEGLIDARSLAVALTPGPPRGR